MSKLDLTPFQGLAWRLYSPERLEHTRYAFAAAVCDFAVTCRSNRELLDGIFAASSPDNGLPWPTVLGEGSTRRAWSLPFGLALKLERTDDLSETEMSTRVSKDYLSMRRRTSALAEVGTSTTYPRLAPRLYGVAFSFGNPPPSPSALIVERLTPLSELRPDDLLGVDNHNMFISRDTGELLLSDPRFVDDVTFAPRDGTPLTDELRIREAGIWLGNIGVDGTGRFFLADTGNIRYEWLNMDLETCLPLTSIPGVRSWEPCNSLSPLHRAQTIALSKAAFSLYRLAYEQPTLSAPEILQAA